MAKILAGAASPLARGHGARIADEQCVTEHKLIGVRHLRCDGRKIPVLLFRNSAGSVAARCLIDPGDTPILDGPSPEAVLSLVAGVIDDLLLARSANTIRTTSHAGVGDPWRFTRGAERAGAVRRPLR